MKLKAEAQLQEHYDQMIATQPNPDICPMCGGIGYVGIEIADYTHPLFGKAFHCPCGMMKRQIKQRFTDLYAEIAKNPGLPDNHKNSTFSSFVDRCAQLGDDAMDGKKVAYDLARRLVRIGVLAAKGVEKYWLILSGDPGVGKSGLAAALTNGFVEQGRPVFFRDCGDLIDMIQGTYNKGKDYKGPSKEDILQLLKTVPVLVIDDMGDPDSYDVASGDARKNMFAIVHTRHELKLITVITTNQDKSSFRHMWGRRIFRRVEERGVWVDMIGPDLSTY